MWEFQEIAQPLESPQQMLDTLRALLLKYHQVFSTSIGLSPSRQCDHKIELIPNAQLIRVKPYRYAHSQKIEIEVQVKKILVEGLIESDTSSFSSLVLLVKKRMVHSIYVLIIGH